MASPAPIRTAHLELIPADARSARLAADDDRPSLSRLLSATIPTEWPPELMGDALEPAAKQLEADPGLVCWSYWFVVRLAPARTLIGNVGLKGHPDPDGRVDVGYSILESHQRQGFATEATRAIVEWAFAHPGVAYAVAETLPGLDASIRVMEKCGMRFVGICTGRENDPGVIRYALRRPERP